jgi:hypothetical protein
MMITSGACALAIGFAFVWALMVYHHPVPWDGDYPGMDPILRIRRFLATQWDRNSNEYDSLCGREKTAKNSLVAAIVVTLLCDSALWSTS